MKTRTIVALLVASMAAPAMAQLNNGSFEEYDAFFFEPDGWKNFTNSGELYRRIDDGQGPILVRTGEASIELASGNNFAGWTSDTLYTGTGLINNPTVEFIETGVGLAGGDCIISGWYAIPANQPLIGAKSCIKAEFRRPNNSITKGFENLTLEGTTNGQWVYFEMVVTRDQIKETWEIAPPAPVSLSMLPIRFGSFASTGTIFWDDLEFFQYCIADFDKTRFVDTDDFDAFVMAFEAGDVSADVDGSGFVDTDDYDFFVNRYELGC
jgi:hypothetical protein